MGMIRKSEICASRGGTLAAVAGVWSYLVPAGRFFRIQNVAMSLETTGSTSGATTVDVKKNGTSILSAVMSIAQGASTKYVAAASVVPGAAGAGEPGGVDVQPGDVLTVDITAIPGTASTGLSVVMQTVQKDI